MSVVGVHRWCTPTPYRTPRSFACQKDHARTSAQNAHTQPAVMWRARRDHGSGALIDPDSRRLRRVFPAELRHSRYARSRGTSGWTDMRVPDPQFPNKTPAGRQSSCPVLASAADGPPDPTPRAGTPSAEQLRGRAAPTMSTPACPSVHPASTCIPRYAVRRWSATEEADAPRTRLQPLATVARKACPPRGGGAAPADGGRRVSALLLGTQGGAECAGRHR